MTESGLWSSLQSGDINALRTLYDHHVNNLYKYGMVLVQDADKVRDSIHDLFVSIWSGRERLAVPQSTKAYLMVSLRRRLFDKGSKMDSMTEALNTEMDPVGITEAHENTWIRAEEESDQNRKLQKAMACLSERQREIIHMKYYQELEYEDISRIMGMNYQSARNLVNRAIAAMRKEMLLIVINILMLL